MPNHLKRCMKCRSYSISPEKCHLCGGSFESVYPPRFSLQDKYQKYRIEYFREKIKKRYSEEQFD